MVNSYLVGLREKKGLTQAELANKIGVSPSAMSSYEQGIKTPRDEVKVRIAEFFDVSIVDVFYSFIHSK